MDADFTDSFSSSIFPVCPAASDLCPSPSAPLHVWVVSGQHFPWHQQHDATQVMQHKLREPAERGLSNKRENAVLHMNRAGC